MGVRSAMALARSIDRASGSLVGGGDVGIRSAFARTLAPIVLGDLSTILGEVGEAEPITRDQAMTLSSVQRARAVLLTLIADKPLAVWRGGERLDAASAPWLYRTTGVLSPWQRMARTVDDLIFHPYSLWLVARGEPADGRRPILEAVHCPQHMWRVNEAGLIEVQDEDARWTVADEDEVILIPGPSDGLLHHASDTFRGSISLERTWTSRAGTPQPLLDIHLTDDARLSDDETLRLQAGFVEARRAPNGAVTVTPAGVELRELGGGDAALFVEGRNAARLDVAGFFNLPGALLDASTATASLTYVTQEATRTSVYDLTLPYWVRPIESRLSQDDVVPRGQSVRFDFSTLTPSAGPTTED